MLVLELTSTYIVKKLCDGSIIHSFFVFLPVKVCTISVELLLGMTSVSHLDGIGSDFFFPTSTKPVTVVNWNTMPSSLLAKHLLSEVYI